MLSLVVKNSVADRRRSLGRSRSRAGKQFADGIEGEITTSRKYDRHRRKNIGYTSCLSRFTFALAANDSALLL